MVGLVDYGSGSESESEAPAVAQPSKLAAKLPPPSTSQAKRPTKKKIAIALPALSSKNDEEEDQTRDDAMDDRPAKKPRLGSGKSSLLGMLPAPKTNKPIAPPKQRVLGGGSGPGLVFNASRTSEASASAQDETLSSSNPYTTNPEEESESAPAPAASSSKPFLLPPSLQKRKPNISLEETSTNVSRPAPLPLPTAQPAVDFFSLGSAKSSAPRIPGASTSSSSAPSVPSVSSAPVIPDYKPPEPTPNDPYPGYYQLPSGAWAAYDTEYYAKFTKKWQDEYNAYVRALEKGTAKGFEGYDDSAAQEIDPVQEMERAKREVQEREERKSLTKGAGTTAAQPKMKITAAKMSGVARSRHQLGTLLKEAYDNREALEERIAEGRRNRKEAGNKYGF